MINFCLLFFPASVALTTKVSRSFANINGFIFTMLLVSHKDVKVKYINEQLAQFWIARPWLFRIFRVAWCFISSNHGTSWLQLYLWVVNTFANQAPGYHIQAPESEDCTASVHLWNVCFKWLALQSTGALRQRQEENQILQGSFQLPWPWDCPSSLCNPPSSFATLTDFFCQWRRGFIDIIFFHCISPSPTTSPPCALNTAGVLWRKITSSL